MPGADTPFTDESASNLLTAVAGTCPSMIWPVASTTPVWHELSSIGTPSFCLTDAMSAVLMAVTRSEEHTSELQSLMRISYAVFCLKKKKKITTILHQLSGVIIYCKVATSQ